MHAGYAALGILLILISASAGCLSSIFPYPQPTPTPVQTLLVTALPTTESPVSTVQVSQMALQPSDMPSDYILKDRSDITYLETDQMAHNLGWRAGYSVTYYRLNRQQNDMTEVSQEIDLYPLANMNDVFNIAQDSITAQATGSMQVYQLPCPSMGEHTAAYRESDIENPFSIPTYTIIFTHKDVFEKLTMSGTTTDFEALKALARTASDKIQ